MIHASDTPPDGDFAAYIERLTGANAELGAAEDLLQPKADASASAPFAASSGMPCVVAPLQPLPRIDFFGHVKWVLIAWVASQALAQLVPAARFLFIPILLVYAVWVVATINRSSSGALAQRMRELARQALEEARKNQNSLKK